MKIDFPLLKLQPGWSARSQAMKIMEELYEVNEAMVCGDRDSAIKEILDAMQTHHTQLQMLGVSQKELDTYMLLHNEKLERKGYI